MKKIILIAVAVIGFGISANAQKNEETVFAPTTIHNWNDVIVIKGGYNGIQTNISHLNDKFIYYKKYKLNGKEKDKKIKQKIVSFTLSFEENVKKEKYPVQMSLQDFLSLPTYNMNGIGIWVVFGTGISNLPQLRTDYPNIPDNFSKGVKLTRAANGLYAISPLIGGIPLIIIGAIIESSGRNKINDAFTKYYNTCVDLKVCEKYGIIITPYNTALNFNK